MPTNRISHTAWLVMLSQIGLGLDPRWGGLPHKEHADFYRACYDYCMRVSAVYRAIHRLIPIDHHLWLIEKMLASGAPQHFVLRKRAIAEQVASCLAAGARQVVVLGAGFDALALHLARERTEITCFEIDAPSMHRHKMQIAREHFGQLPANFYGVGNDFAKRSLHAALSAHPAFVPEKPTLFVAEGLMMYLPQAAVETLFHDAKDLTRRAWLIFSAIEKHRQPVTGPWRALRALILTVKSEHFAWSISAPDMTDFLKQHGFTETWRQGYADLQRPYRTPEETAALETEAGEYLVAASGISTR